MKLISTILATMLALVPTPAGSVSVLYAGSLVRVMEGPVAQTLAQQTGLQFQGEGKGSKALANLIGSGLRNPDVFISADPKLLDGLMTGGDNSPVSSYTVFGSARMVIAYSDRSPNRAIFEAAARGQQSILDVLADKQVRLGRTDPQLDPKGERTVRVLQLLGTHFRQPKQALTVLQKTEIFPEEDLALRVESGEIDAGFFYSTEIPGRGLRAVELPGDANLSRQITYAIAVMRHAPHPQAAKTFAGFILSGAGKIALEQAGVAYFAHPEIVGRP